jgi:peptide/nickel transport system substrate-binding protein
MVMQQLKPALLLSLVLTVFSTACAGSPAGTVPSTGGSAPAAERPAATGPKRITIGIRGTAQVLSGKLNIGNSGLGVADLEVVVNSGLTVKDDLDVLHPILAEAVPTVENGLWKVNPDGTMLTTWKIRQGAQWHDGTPFTTEDLMFTLRVVQDRELPVFRVPTFEAIESAEAPDAQTITVKWKQPFITADRLFSPDGQNGIAVPLPKHLLEKSWTEDKAAFLQHPYWSVDFVGTGAFKVKEYVPDTHLIVVANDKFVLGRPKIDEIEAKFIPDANTIIANLLSGQVDLILDPRSLNADQALQIRDQWTTGGISFSRSSPVLMYPQFLNPTPPQMTDVRFRRALIQAINRPEMNEAAPVQIGIAHTYIGPDWREFKDVDPVTAKYTFDLQRTAQQLQEVGFTRGPDGSYQDASGNKLSVEIRAPRTDINLKSSYTVQNYWRQAGIGAEVAEVPPQRTNEREYRSTFPGVELIRPSAQIDAFTSIKSDNIPTAGSNWAGGNRQRFGSPELDSIIDRYLTTIPDRQRTEALKDAVRFTSDQLLFMGVIFDAPVRFTSNRLKNVPAGIGWQAHEWEVVG